MKKTVYKIQYNRRHSPFLFDKACTGPVEVVRAGWRWVRGEVCMLFASLLILSWIPVNKGNECINEVRNIYKNMKMDDLDKGNVYMNYSVITYYKPQGKQARKPATTTVEFAISKQQIHYRSDEASVYVDAKDNFTIIPHRKVIYWTNSLLEVEKDKRLQAYTLFQDSLFNMSKLVNCEKQINAAEGYDKIITMEPLAKAQAVYPYKTYTFYINTTQRSIKKVVIELLPKVKEVAKMELRYNKIEQHYTKENLSDPVKNIVLNSSDKPNNKYKDYTLIDNRAKK